MLARSLCFPRAASALVMLCGTLPAMAGLPAAFDRVPAEMPVVVGVSSLQEFRDKVVGTFKAVGVPVDGPGPIADINKLMDIPGLNKAGSFAVAVNPNLKKAAGGDAAAEGSSEEAPGVMLIPVSDYNAFITAANGQPGDKIAAIQFGDDDVYAKDIGGGYAAVSNIKTVLEAFDGKAGNLAAHEKRLGSSAKSIADSAEMIVIANIELLQDQMKQAGVGIKQQMDMVAMMSGQAGAANQGKLAQVVMDAFARDAKVSILGVDVGEQGVNIDLASEFKEGSEIAGFFQAKGVASSLLSRAPAKKYLFAGAWDLSAPGIKKIIKNIVAMGAEGQKDGAAQAPSTFMAMADNIDIIDGQSFVLGATEVGAGLLGQTVFITKTKSPEKLMEAQRKLYEGLSGKNEGGLKYTASYKAGAKEVAGVKADEWELKMEPDPNDPAAMQMQMAMGMFLGGDGTMKGYAASVDGAVIQTMSLNTPLLESAVKAAADGKGLGEDAGIKLVSGMLPANRSAELYIGTRELMETVQNFMAMFGSPAEFKLPETLPPIGVGAVTEGGAFRVRFVLPNEVMKTLGEVAKQMEAADQGGDPMDGGDQGEPGAPKF